MSSVQSAAGRYSKSGAVMEVNTGEAALPITMLRTWCQCSCTAGGVFASDGSLTLRKTAVRV